MGSNMFTNIFVLCVIYENYVSQDSESLRFEMSRLAICLTVPIKSDYQSTAPVKIFNGQISSNHKLFRVTGN